MNDLPPVHPKGDRRVVVVDDERIIAEDLSFMLEDLGYTVVGIAGDAARAFEVCDEKRPDLVCMDIVMRGEADGIDAAGKINRELNIPSVFLSAYSDEVMLDRAMEAKPLGYLIKPYDTALLRCTLEVAYSKLTADRELKQMRDAQHSGEHVLVTEVATAATDFAISLHDSDDGQVAVQAKAALDKIAELVGDEAAVYCLANDGRLVPGWRSGTSTEWQEVNGTRSGQDSTVQQAALSDLARASGNSQVVISTVHSSPRGFLAFASETPLSEEARMLATRFANLFAIANSKLDQEAEDPSKALLA